MRNRALIRAAGAVMAAVFAAVGLVFLLFPDAVLVLMNRLGRGLGCPEAPLTGAGFYLALAAAYMAMVTILALGMARHPEDPVRPRLLAQAKAASSLASFGLFIFHQGALVYLANGLVDGAIAAAVLLLLRPARGTAGPNRP